MLEDPVLNPLLCLPHAGIRVPAAAAGEVDQYREPTLDDSCSTLSESVGWWKYVHQAIGHNGQPFGEESHNIVLSLGVDAAQPYNRGGLSITPLLLQVLNLPENQRHLAHNMILAGVIPGKKASTTSQGVGLANLNTYMAPLVTELLKLWKQGFSYRCPILKQDRWVHVKLLFTVCDYPGHAKLNCQQHQGAYFGCQKCDIRATRVDNRMAYVDGHANDLTHAQYVERAHNIQPLNAEVDRCKQIVDQTAKELSILKASLVADKRKLAKLRERLCEEKKKLSAARTLQANEQAKCKSVKGLSELCRLPYFDMVQHTVLDMMHITQGVVSAHLIQLVKGMRTVAKTNKQNKKKDKKGTVAPVVAAAPAAAAEDAPEAMELDDESKQPAVNDEAKHPREDDESKQAAVEGDEEEEAEADTVGAEEASDAESEYDGEDGPAVEEAPQVVDEAPKVGRGAAPLPDPESAAVAAAAAEIKHRATQHARFRILKHTWKDLESGPYARIQAPTGVAPAAKHPLTKTGEMTAHHWVNFVRCYGKYLLQQAYGSKDAEQETLRALCRILDLLALCLRSHVTAESKQETATLVEEVLKIFKEVIPTTEHAIVVHLLLRHIPDTIKLWGPVRSYWCFPFERSDTPHSCSAALRARV